MMGVYVHGGNAVAEAAGEGRLAVEIPAVPVGQPSAVWRLVLPAK